MEPGRTWRTVRRALGLRCPRCGQAAIFVRGYQMRPHCPRCGLRFEREPGYFVGAIYINYGLTVLVVFGGYFLLDQAQAWPAGWQLALWCPVVVLFPLATFRHSKALWLALDFLVDPADPRRTP